MSEVTPALQLPFNLRTIYLRESSTSFSDDFDPLKPGQQLSAKFTSTPNSFFVSGDIAEDGVTQVPQSYTYITRFEFNYMSADAMQTDAAVQPIEVKPVASISANIAVDYLRNPQSPDPTDKEAAAWGHSALIHAWPYWREFCHSAMLRMNLPVLIVPIMVVQHVAPPTPTQ